MRVKHKGSEIYSPAWPPKQKQKKAIIFYEDLSLGAYLPLGCVLCVHRVVVIRFFSPNDSSLTSPSTLYEGVFRTHLTVNY